MIFLQPLHAIHGVRRSIHSVLALLCVSFLAPQAGAQTSPSVTWSGKAQHMIGLIDAKQKQDGILTIDSAGVSFQGKKRMFTLAPSSLIAASSGGERVELWGTKGQILRSVIPDGGGLLLAAFAHHRVGMLTIEYRGADGSRHAAVFLVPEDETHKALSSFPKLVAQEPSEAARGCNQAHIDQQAVQVLEPDWNASDIPVAYRALLYENLIARLEKQNSASHVYRYGQTISGEGCPRYTIRLAASTFSAGNQVQRAAMGPAGMFVGATKIGMNATVRDEVTHQEHSEPITTALRGQSESFGVTAKEAKKIAGKFAKMKKNFEQKGLASAEK